MEEGQETELPEDPKPTVEAKTAVEEEAPQKMEEGMDVGEPKDSDRKTEMDLTHPEQTPQKMEEEVDVEGGAEKTPPRDEAAGEGDSFRVDPD